MNNLLNGVPHGHGENTLEDIGNADVADLVLQTSNFSLKLSFLTSAGEVSPHFQKLLGLVLRFLDPHLGNKEGLEDLTDPVEDGVAGNRPGELQFSLHLIDGSGLVTGEFAHIGQTLALLLLLRAAQVLRGPPDGFLLGFGLLHLAVKPDDFLFSLLVTILDLTVHDEPQSLFDDLFLSPPDVDTGNFSPGGQLDFINLLVLGRLDFDVGDQLDNFRPEN